MSGILQVLATMGRGVRGAIQDVSGSYAVGIQFFNDGTYSTGSGGGDWIDPTTVAEEWEISASLQSGALATGSSATDQWFLPGDAPTWFVDPSPAAAQINISFRHTFSGVSVGPFLVELIGAP